MDKFGKIYCTYMYLGVSDYIFKNVVFLSKILSSVIPDEMPH